MKKSRLLKLALACLLLCVPLILSGCVVQPNNIPANNTGNYPEFPTYNPSTPKPTVNPTQFIDNSGNNGGMVSLPTLPASTNPPVQNNWYTVAPLNTINRPETNTLTPPPDDPTPSPTPQGSLKLGAKGEDVKVEDVMKNLLERDYIDSHREASPLSKADDAIVLDNSEMTMTDQMVWLKEIIAERFGC